jgi:hypothetical protein
MCCKQPYIVSEDPIRPLEKVQSVRPSYHWVAVNHAIQRGVTTWSLEKHVEGMLERFCLVWCNPELQGLTSASASKEHIKAFQKMVGALMWTSSFT